MRKFVIRTALVAFMAAMGMMSSGIQFEGAMPSFESNQASARMNSNPLGCDKYVIPGCKGLGPDPWGVGG